MNQEFNTGTIIVDSEGKIFSSNHFVSYILNTNPNSIIGKQIENFLDFGKQQLIKENGERLNIFVNDSVIYIDNKKYTLYIFWKNDFEIENHPIYRSIVESSFDSIQIVNAEKPFTIIYTSPSMENFGYPSYQITGKRFLEVIHRVSVRDFLLIFENVKKYKHTITNNFFIKGIHQEKIPVECRISPIFDNEGKVIMFSIVIRDTNKEIKKINEFIQNEQYLKSLFDNNPDMVFALDATSLCFTQVNESVYKKTGYSNEEIKERPFSTLISPTYFKEAFENLLLAKKGDSVNFEVELVSKRSKRFYVQLIMFPIKNHGEIVGIYGIAKDIDERKRYQETIQNLAYYDSLTGLPNRSKFQDLLTEMTFAESISTHNPNNLKPNRFALFFFDIDNFKSINDNLGHEAGDELLYAASRRLEKILPNNCILSRISGDEFTIIIKNFEDKSELIKIAQTIRDSFSEPFVLEEQEVLISCSIGGAIHPDDAKNSRDLIRFADIAMYNSKRNGKNRFSFFKKHMVKESSDDFRINGNLNKAFDNKEFQLYFQPIINSNNQKLLAAEALIRWNHPTEGVISPGLFIPLAEASGAIHQLGEYVVNAACKQIKDWILKGLPTTPISINVSIKQLEMNNFFRIVKDAIRKYGLDPSYLIIEVTETIAMNAERFVIRNLRNLKKFGCKLAIDDFGAGHSSLVYLKDFPVDYLKMDQSFIFEILEDKKLEKIVKTIVDLGHLLDLEVIAEGVENSFQAMKLKEIGTDYIQGYYFSKPIKAEDFESEFLRKK